MLITPWVFFRYMVVGMYVGVATVRGSQLALCVDADIRKPEGTTLVMDAVSGRP